MVKLKPGENTEMSKKHTEDDYMAELEPRNPLRDDGKAFRGENRPPHEFSIIVISVLSYGYSRLV